jgi:hypothetical protein
MTATTMTPPLRRPTDVFTLPRMDATTRAHRHTLRGFAGLPTPTRWRTTALDPSRDTARLEALPRLLQGGSELSSAFLEAWRVFPADGATALDGTPLQTFREFVDHALEVEALVEAYGPSRRWAR